MAPPPIQLFLTTIASQPALRQRQEYLLRILQVKKIPFTSYDLASDEDAKRLWKRKAPSDKQQLPGILIGGKFPGGFNEFEEAVEFDELDIFLRRNEDYKPPEDERPGLEAKPIGVPGAYSPLQMFPKHAPSRSPSPSPLKLKEKEKGEIDASEHLGAFGLEGVRVSADDLRALIEELGLGGDAAKDLVKDLGGDSEPATPEKKDSGSAPASADKEGESAVVPEILVQPEGESDAKEKAEEVKAEEVNVEEVKVEEITAEEVKSEEVKPEEAKVEEVKAGEASSKSD
ncbi:hypothetical protein PHLCEN_2v603 [Hermanssonia centrifuga]|uniref:Uncharacterized protein n=1 Tax=Hermanssonia centrifuga TaxID=98765 RepID=A0A2R6S5M2_9APHY|nr:hypothetical protein PHLCEN_2v603 [Hermanssonia centrifuga]